MRWVGRRFSSLLRAVGQHAAPVPLCREALAAVGVDRGTAVAVAVTATGVGVTVAADALAAVPLPPLRDLLVEEAVGRLLEEAEEGRLVELAGVEASV